MEINIKKKVPVGLAALCLVSLIGLKDTGIFVNEHVQTTYSGNKVYFEVGEVADIIEETEDGYLVSKGKAKVTVPFEKVAMTQKEITTYVVAKNTSIKDSEGQILRNLFLGEEVTLVEDLGEELVVKSDDNIKGQVSLENLEFVGTEVIEYETPVVEVQEREINLEELEAEERELEAMAASATVVTANQVTSVAYPVDDEKANQAISIALSNLGTPYSYGSAGNGGFDCSGLIYSVYKNNLGVNLPRSSVEQSQYGTQISRDNLQPGDLIFFNTYGSGVSHVGIYMGDNNFVHASSGEGKVVVSSLTEDYYNSRYVNATRVL